MSYEKYRNFLEEFIRFKSISTDEQYLPEIEKTVSWLENAFVQHGFDTKIFNEYGNPIVVASYTHDATAPKCLVYGHYDVQPAVKEGGWQSEPFVLDERDGRLYGRGVADNKGQLLVHLTTIFELIAQNKLAYNVTFVVEGNEETASKGLAAFMEDQRDLLQADVAIISDGELWGVRPALDVGFRGAANVQVAVKTASHEVHSGLFGGLVPNAAAVLINLLSGIYDQAGKVQIAHFYDGVFPIPQHILEQNQELAANTDKIITLAGNAPILSFEGIDYLTQVGQIPSLEVTGISSGYTGDGFKNSIPPVATAKMNIRTAPDQDPEVVKGHVERYFQENAPTYAELSFASEKTAHGIAVPDNQYTEQVRQVLQKVYGELPVERSTGATLPIAYDLHRILGVDQVYVPLANEDCQMHAVDENIIISCILKGLEFSQAFFEKK